MDGSSLKLIKIIKIRLKNTSSQVTSLIFIYFCQLKHFLFTISTVSPADKEESDSRASFAFESNLLQKEETENAEARARVDDTPINRQAESVNKIRHQTSASQRAAQRQQVAKDNSTETGYTVHVHGKILFSKTLLLRIVNISVNTTVLGLCTLLAAVCFRGLIQASEKVACVQTQGTGIVCATPLAFV